MIHADNMMKETNMMNMKNEKAIMNEELEEINGGVAEKKRPPHKYNVGDVVEVIYEGVFRYTKRGRIVKLIWCANTWYYRVKSDSWYMIVDDTVTENRIECKVK